MNRIYKRKNFDIYGYKRSYIVYNRNKPFDIGHTHINNYKTAKYLIQMSITNTVPNHLSLYLLESLIRISSDKKYIELINNKIEELKKKKSQYH